MERAWPRRIGGFELVAPIEGVGHTASFRAWSDEGREGVVKILPRPPSPDPDPLRAERFLKEANRLVEYAHPGLVRVLDAGVLEDAFYLVLARQEGSPLSDLVTDGPVDLGVLLSVALELADTLASLHDQGITVRDLDPDHVVITPDGRALLRGPALGALTRVGLGPGCELIGAPGFVAPELLLGIPPSALSDQFAYGRMLLFLLGVVDRTLIEPGAPIRPQLESSLAVPWSRYPPSEEYVGLRPMLERMTMARAAERFPSMRGPLDVLVSIVLEVAPAEASAPEVAQVGDDTVPNLPRSQRDPPVHEGDATISRRLGRTHSIVLARGGELEVYEDTDEMDEIEASGEIESVLAHLRDPRGALARSESGRSPLLTPAGLRPDDAGEGTEPVTVPDRVRRTDVTSPSVPRAPRRNSTAPLPPPGATDGPDDDGPTRPGLRSLLEATDTRPPPLEPEWVEVSAFDADDTARRDAPAAWKVFVAAAVVAGAASWGVRAAARAVWTAPVRPAVLPVERRAGPVYLYEGDGPLDQARVRRAHAHLTEARRALKDLDAGAAERALGACIQAADLGPCHRALASLWSLLDHPSAGAHLARYLVTPNADLRLERLLRTPPGGPRPNATDL